MTAPELTDAQRARLTQPRYTQTESFAAAPPSALVPLLAELRFGWDGAEAGAPMVDAAQPLTDGAPWDRVAEAIGSTDADRVVDAWLSMSGLLRLAGLFGQIEPGRYALRNTDTDWIMGLLTYPDFTPVRAGIGADGQVTLTADQIALIRNQYWEWTHYEVAEEILEDGLWPGPSADAKRPYGDMSFFANDIHRILNWPVESRDAEGWIEVSGAQVAEADALHRTMLAATQVYFENVTLDADAAEVQEVVARWAEDT